MSGRQGGFLLLPVVLGLALIASVAFLLSREGAMHVRRAATETGIDQARYVAEAGLQHQRWLANQSACTGYPSLGATDFGPHAYSAAITPADGSPVEITASGQLADGTQRTVRKENVAVFDAPRTITLQPGRTTGRDTYLSSEQSDANYGADADLRIDPEGPPGGDRRSLLRFDLSGLAPGASVESAQLELYLHQNTGDPATVEVHRMVRDWVEGTGTANSGATWQEYDGLNNWTTPGGDYAATALDSYSASSVGWKSLDVLAAVQGWVDGAYPNQGLILRAQPDPGNKEKRHYSGDSAQCALRPKLTLTYRCECGTCDFPQPPAPVCSADFVPDQESGSFSTSALGAGDVWGVAFLADCVAFNGTSAPLDGAWLLVDTGDKKLRMVDRSGTALSTLDTPTDHVRDAAYIQAGAWRDHLAVTEENERRVYFLDLAGAVQSFFSTSAFTQRPVGITYIGRTASGVYENHLAISGDKDGLGASNAGVHIVDQDGNLQQSIDVSGLAPEPWGVTHLAGTDKLMVADKQGIVFFLDFEGNLLGQYDAEASFGASQIQGIAVNPMTCEHVISDHDTQQVLYLEDN